MPMPSPEPLGDLPPIVPLLPLLCLALYLLVQFALRLEEQYHEQHKPTDPRRRSSSASSSAALPSLPVTGWAARYRLAWVYREGDEWLGGLQAIRLDRTRTGERRPLRDVLEEEGPEARQYVIYCLDVARETVVFMELQPGADLLEEPFLDRGVRRLAGDHVLLASFATVEAYLKEKRHGKEPGEGERLLWVWNTGRCGSTLLHRLLLATGRICSLSEPYWAEQLCRARAEGTVDGLTLWRLVQLCLPMDALLLRHQACPPSSSSSSTTPPITSLNLKGLGHYILEIAQCAFPHAENKHLFLYRDIVPVVESLASVFYQASSPLLRASLLAFPRWTMNLATPLHSKRLRGWLQEGTLDMAGLGRMGKGGVARGLALAWLDALCTWVEVMERPKKGGKGGGQGKVKSMGTQAVLRMEELVDPTQRKAMVRKVLDFIFSAEEAGGGTKAIGAEEEEKDEEEKYLAVFGRHSQQGSRMQQSSAVTGKRFLTRGGEKALRALLASVPDERIRSLQLPHGLMEEGKKEE